MMRRVILALAMLSLGACGGATEIDPPPAVGAGERGQAAVERHLADLTRRQEQARRDGDAEAVQRLEEAIREVERAQDEAFDEELRPTPFDEVVDRLPIREPPLHVEQYVLDGSHELVVRPRARAFFCGRTPAQRRAAVREFYEAADRMMRAAGVEDFSLVVDALRESGEVRPLARARAGTVTLTARGRARGRC